MSQVDEIKCPSCGKWSEGTGRIDQTCPYCNAHINPSRYHYEEERKITAERQKNNSYLVVDKNEDPIVQMFKQFVNWLRWGTFYGVSVIVLIIAGLLVLYGLVML